MSKLLNTRLAPCRSILPFAFLLLTFAGTAFAQSSTATLSGTIEDENGAVIPGAKITVTHDATAQIRYATTNDSGSFSIPLLPPGEYTVLVERDGFTRVQLTNIVLNVGDQKAVQVQLKVGDIASTVEVRPDEALVETSPAVGTVVDRQFVENMPLNGRSFQSLIALSPGVVLTKSSFSEQGQFSVNGQRADANYFTVDGVSANIGVSAGSNLGQSGAGSLPGFSAAGGSSNLVSVDALQEFKIQTSTYAPEFGRTPGGQVQIVTRSGTNEFHGTLFEYFRNDALDANDWFANANNLGKPALRQNDFGGVLGGPIFLPRFGEGGPRFYDGRHRTFFFFSYEGLRLRLPQVGTSEVPSLISRQNAPSQVRPFLDAFPLPNGSDTANGLARFTASYSDPSSLDATSIRVDHAVGINLTLFGRFSYAPSQDLRRGAGFSLNTLNYTTFNTQTFTTGATWLITSKINNEFRANWSRNKGAAIIELDSFGGAVVPADSFLFPSPLSRDDDQFQLVIRGGTATVYRAANKPVNNFQRQINLVDNLMIVAGDHQLKMGVDYRRLSPINEQFRYAVNNIFQNVDRAISGVATSITINAFSGGPRFPLFSNLSLYAQDSWKVTSRLLFTYGLRWELNPPPTEKNGNLPFAAIGLDNPATIALAPRGTPLYQTTYNNFAPRVGVSYQLSKGKGRETVLRGGFGVFYDLGYGQIANAFGFTYPYIATATLTNVQFPLTSAIPIPIVNPDPPFPAITVFDSEIKSPFTYQWNVALEQSLSANQTVSASYVGAAGRRLLRQEALNRPNANFSGFVNVTRNSATSDYHAMQLHYNHRLSNGLRALASYTWAHSIDNASNDSNASFSIIPATIIDPEIDRGSSDFDVRHAFNAAISYNLPTPKFGAVGKALLRNWSVHGIGTARSATPVDLIGRIQSTGGFFANLRPDVIPDVPLYVENPAVPGGRKFNREAFTAPPPGRQGTLGRNVLRGFPVYQVDLAVSRQFSLTERAKLQFKGEMFNLFNHPNFGDPGAQSNGTNDISNALFGQSTQMLGRSLGSGGLLGGFNPLYQIGGPRSIQLAIKVLF